MTHAYDKTYLDRARTNLGRMLDYAVHDMKYDIDYFFELFLTSGVAARFENGDFTILAGMSGVELAYEVLRISKEEKRRANPSYATNRSKEYWVGWALAYYQWETGLSFEEIKKVCSLEQMVALYNPYHEMDVRQFVDKMNELYRSSNPATNLKRIRQKAGLSQSELANFSGVPLRTIQQYEQRQKNINKAQVEYLVTLSKTLCCEIEALIEKV